MFETDDDFRPPEPVDGVTGYHFRRTPRPGQGRLTGRPTLGLSLVLISPREPEQAQALRDWADFVHIRHIAAAGVPGFTMITPYENATGGDPRFLHFYELDTDDPEPAFQRMTPTVSERIGAPDTDAWKAWATTPELKIWYVNSFRRLGEHARVIDVPDFFTTAAHHRARTAPSPTIPYPMRSSSRSSRPPRTHPAPRTRQPWVFVVVRDPATPRRHRRGDASGVGGRADAIGRRPASTPRSSPTSTGARPGA